VTVQGNDPAKFPRTEHDATEEQIFDRASLKNLFGLRLVEDIPDAKTLWDFRQGLKSEGRDGARRFFEAFGAILENPGLSTREGSIVDASFAAAPRQRNRREQNRRLKEGELPEEFDENPAVGRQKESEARWTKKNHEVHYGWKHHVKADVKTELILSSIRALARWARPSRAG
jgi:IS5 family transposase